MSTLSKNPNYIDAPKAHVPDPSNLTKVIIDFETSGEPNLQAYDAQPQNPAVHDTTIVGYGFNLNRSDARAVFHKLLPGVDFDKVKAAKQNITKDQALKLFNHDMELYVNRAKERLGSDLYNSLPGNVKSAVISAIYRGDLGPKTVGLMKKGRWQEVSVEYLNHQQYKDAQKLGIIGIRKRMNWNAEQFNTMIR